MTTVRYITSRNTVTDVKIKTKIVRHSKHVYLFNSVWPQLKVTYPFSQFCDEWRFDFLSLSFRRLVRNPTHVRIHFRSQQNTTWSDHTSIQDTVWMN